MTNNPIESKAYLWREGDRWVIGLELSGWLSQDLLKELDGHVLTELNTSIDLNNPNIIEFAQMPLQESTVVCPNCENHIKIVNVPESKPRGVADRLFNTWRKLWIMK